LSTQIIAVGGGGFSTASEPGLDTYILNQARSKRPKIGFIGTASGDSDSYILRFYTRFSGLECEPSHLELFRRTPNVLAWLLNQDVIFVGGGNTKSMLAVWETWNLMEHLRTAADAGVILAGISAGAICWFNSGVTDSVSGDLTALGGLGFIRGSCCPHYSLESERRPTYRKMIAAGEIESGIAIDDGACVHFIDGIARRIVSGKTAASAYNVSVVDKVVDKVVGKIISQKIEEVVIPNVEIVNVAS